MLPPSDTQSRKRSPFAKIWVQGVDLNGYEGYDDNNIVID